MIEGLAFAWSYPAKQGFLVQVAPPAGWGACRGSKRVAAGRGSIGTLLAPVLYGYMSGYIISVAGVVSLIGLALAAPVLHREWHRLKMSEATVEKSAERPI